MEDVDRHEHDLGREDTLAQLRTPDLGSRTWLGRSDQDRRGVEGTLDAAYGPKGVRSQALPPRIDRAASEERAEEDYDDGP